MIPADVLRGKRVLVTGAGQGNGRGIAIGMAQAGADLLLLDRNGEACHETLALAGAGATGRVLQADITDRLACRQLAADLLAEGVAVDCLVNNAGILLRGGFDTDSSPELLDQTLRVNVTGTYNMVHAFLPNLTASKGSVINIGSILSFVASYSSAPYIASKGAILQLTKALALELAPKGIRVNGIAPGVMRTPMTVDSLGDPATRGSLLRHVPMARPGEPEELAGPAVFLASDMASYVTGVMLPVDGGYLTI